MNRDLTQRNDESPQTLPLVGAVLREAIGVVVVTVILSFIGMTTIAKHAVTGLDVRFGWTVPLPLVLQMVAMGVAALGYALMT